MSKVLFKGKLATLDNVEIVLELVPLYNIRQPLKKKKIGFMYPVLFVLLNENAAQREL